MQFYAVRMSLVQTSNYAGQVLFRSFVEDGTCGSCVQLTSYPRRNSNQATERGATVGNAMDTLHRWR